MVRYVAGDIGGTNSRLQLVELPEIEGGINQELERVIAEETYPSQQYASLTFIIQKFLAAHNAAPAEPAIACCLAVAGPVRANKSIITNVNWVLDGEEMATALNMRAVQIINDFVAVGYGVLALERSDVIPINDVPITADAPKACIGAGTGLGEAYLTWNGTEYDVWSSEGGHADFAPRDELEFKMMEFFKVKGGVPRVSVERLVSGMGIPRLYDFYCAQHPQEVHGQVEARIRTEDPGSVIAEYAQSGQCDICRQTIDTFVSCYGAEAGNLALKTLPFGGLYVAGGIAPKLLWAMQKDHNFWHNLVSKGRMRGLLEKVPTFIVTHKQVGLLGAKVVCRRLLRDEGFSLKGELSHFSESAPRGVDVLEGTGRDVEAIVDSTGRETGSVVMRRRRDVSAGQAEPSPVSALHEGADLQRMDSGSAYTTHLRKRRVVHAEAAGSVGDVALMRAAVVGGLIASVSVLLLNSVIQRYVPSRK